MTNLKNLSKIKNLTAEPLKNTFKKCTKTTNNKKKALPQKQVVPY